MSVEPGLRADAERNRERILVAAEEAFLERGACVSLEEVAKRANCDGGPLALGGYGRSRMSRSLTSRHEGGYRLSLSRFDTEDDPAARSA